jgi:hypothetical protein
MASKADFEKLRQIKASNVENLLKKKNVVGVGIGAKLKAGVPTGELAIRIYVKEKEDSKRLKPEDAIPRTLDGAATDVVVIGQPIAYGYTARARPAIGGDSIGHFNVTAGTLGCLVRDKTDGSTVILSNNHILANKDALAHPGGVAGDCIVQPGVLDGGTCAADRIATLKRWVKLKETGSGNNTVDAAIAQPLLAADVSNTIHEIGCVSQWRDVTDADVITSLSDPDNVQKSGRTTEYTTGKITDIDMTVTISYGSFSATHEHVIVTDNMASPGDSGSLLVDMSKKAVGLLFGGSPGVAVFYSRISNVLSELNLEFLPCGSSCLLGPSNCKIGGLVLCRVGGPNSCSPGPIACFVGGPVGCASSGPLLCVPGGPVSPLCPVGGPNLDPCKFGPGGQYCGIGPKVGCVAGPPLMDDPRKQVIDPADIEGCIAIDATKLSQADKVNVANLVNKLRGPQ